MRFALLLAAMSLCACSALQADYELCTVDSQCSDAFGGGWVCAVDSGHCEHTVCTSNTECRESFGRGWGCDAEEGHCEVVAADSRCQSHPPGMLDELSAHEDRILIGSVFDQTDFLLMVKAARLAVMQVNDRGGLGGTEIGIIECTNRPDDPNDELAFAANSVEAGLYLTDTLGISSIIGPATSGRTLNAYNAWSAAGTMLISPSATSPELTTADGVSSTDEAPGLLWRTAPPDSLQGEVIAREMIEVEDRSNVAVISQTGAYGDGLADVFQLHFDGGGRASEKYPFTSSTDLAEVTVEVAGRGHDGVLVISSKTSDIVDFFNAAVNLGPQSAYVDMTIFLPDAARDVQLVQDTTPGARALLFPNVRGTGPSSPAGPAFNNFVSAFGLFFDGEDPTDFVFSAHAYDAAWLALAGLAWATHNEPAVTGIGAARGLRRVSDPNYTDPNPPFNPSTEIGPGAWTTIQSFFEAGQAINLQGASGSLDFDPDDGETTAPMDVWEFAEPEPGIFEEAVLYCVDLSPEPRADCCASPPPDGVCP